MERKMDCRVCGKPATGVHYGVWACTGCKSFYRRGVEKKVSYYCYSGTNQCFDQANGDARSRCKACRFRKCAFLGMRVAGLEAPDEVQALQRKVNSTDSAEKKFGLWVCPRSGQEVDLEDVCKVIELCHNLGKSRSPNLAGIVGNTGIRDWRATCSEMSPVPAVPSSPSSCGSPGFSGLDMSDRISTPSPGYVFYPDFLSETRMLSPVSDGNLEFRPITGRCAGNAEENRQQRIASLHGIERAVQTIFGDQIAQFTACRERCLRGEVMDQPIVSLDEMVTAIHQHNCDMVNRVLLFDAMIPGMDELEPEVIPCTMTAWKWVVGWTIHYAPFLTNLETFITVGEQQLQYSRHWQEMITQWPIMVFIYKSCTELRDIGLTQTERYLLMAVITFEPDNNPAAQQSIKLQIIHRHYTDLLLDVIKRRCKDTAELNTICLKLGNFFETSKMANKIHRNCYDPPRDRWPPWSVTARSRISQLTDFTTYTGQPVA